MHAAKRLSRRGAERVLDASGAHPALEALLRDAARPPDGPLPGEGVVLGQFRARRLVEGWSPTPTPVRTSRFRRPALGAASVVAAGIATTVAIGAVALVAGTDRVPGLSGLSGQQPAGAVAGETTTTSSGTHAPSSTTSGSAAPGQTPHRTISPLQLEQLVQPCTTFLVALEKATATATSTAVAPGSYQSGSNGTKDSSGGGSGDASRRTDSHHRHGHHSPVHHPVTVPAPPAIQAPQVLVEAAGGADKVPAFCTALVTHAPSQPATTTASPTAPSSVPPPPSSTSPSTTQTGYSITSDLGKPPG